MKILVIEDEPRIAKYIKKGLELKSHIVDVAHDGGEGYDLASVEKYDVIILDRMLPQLNGMEICRKLRNEKNPTPILMLTAKTQVEDRVEGLEAGADDYLTKPFAFAELLARLNALSRRPPQTTSNILQAGNLILNNTTNQVIRNGKSINLSKKEYALLEFLLRHQGQTLTKEQLLEQVWAYDSDVLPNTVQVYIGYLRTKIDRAFPKEQKLIHTIRGFGYRLNGNKI